MQTKILGSFFAFILGLMLFSSCAKDTVVVPAAPPVPTVTIGFDSAIQKPIFTPKCATSGCHAGMFAPDLTAGKAYAQLFSNGLVDTLNPTKSEIYTVMNAGGSMATHCSQDDANTVLGWIQQGAKNN